MQQNLFKEIFKYRQSSGKTPLENYITEIFAYIMRQLILSKDKIAYELLALFGFNRIDEKNIEKIQIITQKSYDVENRKVIPDITLKLNKKISIIENKINSGLNFYKKTKNKYIDQIELYKKINGVKNVFLLSKYTVLSSSLNNNNRILWSQICSILEKSKNEIIQNFVFFLEENGMKSSIVNNGAENGIGSIVSIMNLIEKSWQNEKYPLEKPEITRDYFGFYLYSGKVWIGQLLEKKDYIVFELLDKRLIKKAENTLNEIITEKDSNECCILTEIKISDIASSKTEREQQEKMLKWFDKKINKIL